VFFSSFIKNIGFFFDVYFRTICVAKKIVPEFVKFFEFKLVEQVQTVLELFLVKFDAFGIKFDAIVELHVSIFLQNRTISCSV